MFAENEVPSRIPQRKNVAYVVNTHPNNMPGQHWVAFYFAKDTVFYFDSYGRDICYKSFLKFALKRKTNQIVRYRQRLQGSGKTCGEYCMYFILAMQGHVDMKVFGSAANVNDRVVKRIVRKEFSIVKK